MTEHEQGFLMIISGALHDIAEKSHEAITKKQIEDVNRNIQKLVHWEDESRKKVNWVEYIRSLT